MKLTFTIKNVVINVPDQNVAVNLGELSYSVECFSKEFKAQIAMVPELLAGIANL